jgi:ATP-dependent exoDNAse (exonuclease V) beta subunit
VLQAVNNNKERHEILQKFMLANDSVTVAVEVPVWLDNEDIEHFKSALGFDIPLSPEKAITGHIDILQLRNGSVHILDYKPDARKERPIEQLTIYALALSRLTGLRLYEFKCAWFDDKNYYEFYPLHIVYKRRMKRLSKDQTRLSGLAESENEGEKYGVEQIHQ